MNKRSSPRFPVSVDARINFPDGSSRVCDIRDYCSGGMYVLCKGEAGEMPSGVRGKDIQVEFSDPLMPRAPVVRIDAKVVRLEPHGLGLAFLRENMDAVVALSQLAAKQAAQERGDFASASETYGQATVNELVVMCLRKTDEHLGLMLTQFMKTARDDLFEAANIATSNSQQSACFGAMNELRSAQDVIISSFHKKLASQFELLTKQGFRNRFVKDQEQTSGLSLLESSELDSWLAVRSMAASLEERLGETLEALEQRLEAISVNPVNAENNPAGPFVLAAIFSEEMDRLMIEDDARRLLFVSMAKVMQTSLKKLHDELNESMIARGVLPILAKTLEVVRGSGRGGSLPQQFAGDEPSRSSAETGPDYAEGPGYQGYQGYPQGQPQGQSQGQSQGQQRHPGQAPQYAPQGAGQQANQGAAPQGGQGGYQGQQSAPTSQQAAAPGEQPQQSSQGGGQFQSASASASASLSQNESTSQQAGPSESSAKPIQYTRGAGGSRYGTARGQAGVAGGSAPFHGVQELMRLQQVAPAEGAEGVAAGPVSNFSSGQVLQAIARLGEELGQLDRSSMDALAHVNQISRALSDLTGESGMVLSEADRDAVAYVGGLFSSIHHDPYLSPSARPWYEKLEVPLLKAGVLDTSLLEDESHPARQILNRLETIADRLEGDQSSTASQVRQQVEQIISAVPEKVEEDPDIFVNTLGQLEKVQEEVQGGYEENIKKLIAECEREKSINRARKVVLEALNQRLGKREVPVLVLNLLDAGWKNLLLRTMLKNGEDSMVYKTYLSVIDQLSARLTRTDPYLAESQMGNSKLLEWIGRMLSIISSNEIKNTAMLEEIEGHLDGSIAKRPATRKVAAIASKSAAQSKDAQRPEEVSEDVWELMLEDASLLHDREAFRHAMEEGESQATNLVWQDKEDDRYVFADGRGLKALDLHIGQVANYLYDKRLVRVGEKEISITERATYSFLQNLHNQLAFQANHDQLTGLLNRKAFEHELEQACADAASGEISHVLAYMDLDRFNVINTTCGHAEGDVLLGKVAKVIQDTLKDEAVIARLGGDEFGMLLKKCSRTKGLMLITRVHDNLRKMRFACNDNEFKVTASVGVSEISADSESGGKLLSAVDSATFTAKENGRDNIQIHNPENERINTRRNILDWVGRINVLFDKNLIQLRCQKIVPLHRTVNSLPQYEILLDVHDESGNQVPLDEFIVAAERYNRITDIDTWVVAKVFDWLEEHKDKLSRIANLSINLSGVSIGNRHFMDEVFQRMDQEAFPSDKVCFEVTESIAISNVENAARFMKKLKDTGCRFSLDDFGKGTSSYAYLRSLPIDYVKIDGAFVKDIATNSGDYAVVKSINEIAHVMGKQTIAEYVEDDFAYEALRAIGLDFVQGYGVEKPIPLYKLFG